MRNCNSKSAMKTSGQKKSRMQREKVFMSSLMGFVKTVTLNQERKIILADTNICEIDS